MRTLGLTLGLLACGAADPVTVEPATAATAPSPTSPGTTPAGTTPAGTTPTTPTTPTTGTTPTGTTGGTAAPLAVCVNELMPGNVATWPVGDGFPDWIELFNPGPSPVDLDGWTISDDPDDPGLHRLGALVVPPGGALVLYASGDPSLGPAHLGFKLAGEGESVVLQDPTGAQNIVQYGNIASDWAAVRQTDCCRGDCWTHRFGGSPGASNE